jgi:hypothetical protein
MLLNILENRAVSKHVSKLGKHVPTIMDTYVIMEVLKGAAV